MKTLIAFSTVLLLLALPVIAQEPSVVVHVTQPAAAAATGIDLSGPDKAKSGETVTLYLTGTPAIDLTKPLTAQLDWLMGADAMSAHLQVPGQPMSPLDVEGTIVFAASGATLRPQVHFVAGTPGEYRVVVDWNFGQNQLVEHVVVVEGDSPDPFPDPQPLPDGIRVVMVLSESSDRTPQEVAQVTALRRQLASLPNCHFQLLDPDTPSIDNWADPFKAEAKRLGIARALVVAVLPTSGGPPVFAGVEALPATAAESMAFAKGVLGL
jgi:hypothetical protein